MLEAKRSNMKALEQNRNCRARQMPLVKNSGGAHSCSTHAAAAYHCHREDTDL